MIHVIILTLIVLTVIKGIRVKRGLDEEAEEIRRAIEELDEIIHGIENSSNITLTREDVKLMMDDIAEEESRNGSSKRIR